MDQNELLFVIKARNEARRVFKESERDIRSNARAAREGAKSFREQGRQGRVLGQELQKVSAAARAVPRISIGGAQFREAAAGARVLSTAIRGITLAAGALGVAFAGTAIIGDAVTQFRAMEASLARVQGLVGLTANEVEAFKAPIRELSDELGKSQAELAEGLFFITSAGLRGEAALEGLEFSAKGAEAGLGEVRIVANALTSALNAYGEAGLSAERATNILVASVRAGKFETDEFAASVGRVLPLAVEAGISFDEVGAAVAALSRISGSASDSLTGVRAIIVALARSNKEGEKTLKAAGTSFEELRKTIREDGLLAGLQELRRALGDDEAAFVQVLGRVEAATAALSLTGSQARAVEQVFADLASEADVLTPALEAVAATSDDKVTDALNRLRNVGQDLAASTLPAVAEALDLVSNSLDAISEVAASAAIAGLVVAASRLAPALVLVANIVRTLGFAGLAAAAGLVATRFGVAAVAARGLSLAMRALPFGLVFVGVELITRAIITYNEEQEEAARRSAELKEILTDLGNAQADNAARTIAAAEARIKANRDEITALRLRAEAENALLDFGVVGGESPAVRRIKELEAEIDELRLSVREAAFGFEELREEMEETAGTPVVDPDAAKELEKFLEALQAAAAAVDPLFAAEAKLTAQLELFTRAMSLSEAQLESLGLSHDRIIEIATRA
ncbi:MAG: phage tail tape measure protein, partial [Acidobacteriota bacterium]|nr:phage tail tape measure protein [Acidobacteriota bacterium]